MGHEQKAPLETGAGLREDDLTGDAISLENNGDKRARLRLDLFGARCRQLVERVRLGSMSFIDAVDMAYSAAVWSGLVDDVGDDVVQKIVADAFMRLRRP